MAYDTHKDKDKDKDKDKYKYKIQIQTNTNTKTNNFPNLLLIVTLTLARCGRRASDTQCELSRCTVHINPDISNIVMIYVKKNDKIIINK